ncbi:hypothetical protein H7849_01935 [Alloacidobacterium dinghuense]|uniref:T3SS negative regulator,GrlR n=1 Tax=Alloacidobacterium dinghuense TaxID=2763107 RepID=A0A7G8BJR5_9BACT|nr:GrlR family regulatory protein [Alloacidobacterium dinghuense]QNI32785.1 hypothetical protein H7849_01935 [Alloacidobacterium dinghuense]
MDGLWTVEFGSSAGIFGGGIAVLSRGKIYGGDSGYFYLGSYRLENHSFTARLEVQPFIDSFQSVFGTIGKRFTLLLEGSLKDENNAIAQGQPIGMPEMRFGAKLTKRSDVD